MFKNITIGILAIILSGCAHDSFEKSVPNPVLKARDAELVKQAPQFKLDAMYDKVDVPYTTKEKVGTIIIESDTYALYHVQKNGRAIKYAITVGAESFGWTGEAYIARKAEWPNWTPPSEMLKRWPHLPRHFAGGPKNPLGARALYIYQDGRDTLYRIHGTNEPESIGTASSSGCIRLTNMDIIHLFENVPVGTKVIAR